MKVSLKTIKQFLDFDLPPVDELVFKIGSQLGEVESVENLGDKYQGVVIVKVAECEKLENSDHLNRCLVDDGGKVKDVERNNNGLVQVVTGAPNVHKDMLAAWLPPGTTVPETYGKDEFVLESRKMRGAISHGMLASQRELELSDEHEGILEVEEDAKPGDDFAKVYGLDDTVIDIENKMFTHRPDCFGQLGVAREISAICQGVTSKDEGFADTRYQNPDWYWQIPEFAEASGLDLTVSNDVSEKVPRFMAVAMKDVEVKPSPDWLQKELIRLGSRPINNIVDITNYLMLITAQPVHAYDYDRLRGHKLSARLAKKGEKVKLLNGKTYQLDESDIVIADGEGAVGLAGIMGGGNSEVSAETKNIVLEVANFNMYSVRKSSMRHGLFTDALTRFNKGQSPLQNDRVLARLMQLMTEHAGAAQASNVFDAPEFTGDKTTLSGEIAVSTDFINSRLGTDLTTDQIGNLLRRVNFASYPQDDGDKDTPVYVAPFWRTDIEIPEDIVEEVGRLYGYDKLPLELPKRSLKPATRNQLLDAKAQIRANLAAAGANETLNYSFVHGNLLKRAGQNPEHAYQIANALSPDLQYYRLSLMPSLLANVHANLKAGYDQFALFEIGKAHIKDQLGDNKLPREDELTALVVAASDKARPKGAAYYLAKHYLKSLLGDGLSYKPVPEAMQDFDITKPYDMARTAFVYYGDKFLGLIGEFRQDVAKNLKLPEFCAGFELDTIAIQGLITGGKTYAELPKYPGVVQDISLKVPADVSYQDLHDLVESELKKAQPENCLASLEPLDIFQKPDDKAHKQIAFRYSIASYDKTLKSDQVNALLDTAAQAAHQKHSAERL